MPYIGAQPLTGEFIKLDSLNASATATYALQRGGVAFAPASAEQLIVSLNGVTQAPNDAYSVAHCENDGYPEHAQRHLSYMTYLTTIDDGGGTMFTQQDVVTPSNAGLTVIWPAGWTHYHHGVPAPTETKYIITGWCCY